MRKAAGGLVLAGLVIAVGLAQTGPGHAVLRGAGLFEAPSQYTALAFTHPQDLPVQLASKHASAGVSFEIRNVSAAGRTYHWSIQVVRAGRSRVAASGLSRVPAEASRTVARAVPVSCAGGRVRVVARLAAPPESIAFWTSCWSRRGGAT
jgi:hypothetical protein